MGRVTGLMVTECLLLISKFPLFFSLSACYLFRILTLAYYCIVTGRLKTGIEEPEWTFIARQRFGKQALAEMNTHAAKELHFLSNGEVKAPL
jgi:hypothetical protein